jgi:two-component system, sensor histidine kinase and response regulator
MKQIGLGLAFCKMVVEAHGGQIQVGDHPPIGCMFTITLPGRLATLTTSEMVMI